jgi:hypothetical protein
MALDSAAGIVLSGDAPLDCLINELGPSLFGLVAANTTAHHDVGHHFQNAKTVDPTCDAERRSFVVEFAFSHAAIRE